MPGEELPVGAVLAAALMAANYGGDSGEDVDRLIAELAKRGYRVAPVDDGLDVARLHRAMVALDSDDPGVFNVIAISEPDTRPVARLLAAYYANEGAR